MLLCLARASGRPSAFAPSYLRLGVNAALLRITLHFGLGCGHGQRAFAGECPGDGYARFGERGEDLQQGREEAVHFGAEQHVDGAVVLGQLRLDRRRPAGVVGAFAAGAEAQPGGWGSLAAP